MTTAYAEHGFDRIDDRVIPELDTRAIRYRHRKTGADFLSLQNEDENKVFGITFRTVPADSTGIAHILEHSVLCGSEKYPVKEPFVELLKGSLKTFLNAFTFPDKTCYPVASPNAQDLYNLMDVYLDAVFHPRLSPMVLRQEGWHLHREAPDAPATLQGVVYNEMKGVYSSPDALLGEALQQSLFPDTPYGLDSGGDPRCIPDLTWQAFQAFHQRRYHPSNALIFMAGDDDPEERLRRLNPVLSAFNAESVEIEMPLQASFDSPREQRRPFCADAEGPDADRGLVAMGWGLPEPLDPMHILTFEVLAHILLGTSASPLRKALIDSGLGEGLAVAGIETQLRQMYFAAGLRGIRPQDTGRMESVIEETLLTLVDRGVERDLAEASLNTVEFVLREQNTGSFPRGLALMLRALPGWLHGADPIDHLAFESPLEALKNAAQTPRFFEDLIDRHLLRNPHRVTLTLEPDPAMANRLEQEEQQRIERMLAALSQEEREAIPAETRALQQAQETPDAPEDLARIPSLSIDDLPRTQSRCPGSVDGGPPRIFLHPLPTRGVVYMDCLFDAGGVRPDLLPLVPVFARALLETGTAKEDFVSLSRRIGRETGGLAAHADVVSRVNDGTPLPWLRISGKALAPRTGALLAIIADVLREARIHDGARIGQLILEAKAAAESSLIHAGHVFVLRRIAARLEPGAWIRERMEGIEALFSLRSLARRIASDGAGVCADLELLREMVLDPSTAVANIAAESEDLDPARRGVRTLMETVPGKTRAPVGVPAAGLPECHEALLVPSQVNFVGLGGSLAPAGYRFHGSALVATRLLSTGWLWDRIRVQGGAYGAFFRISRATRVFTFGSYRDPHVSRTLDVFRAAPEWLNKEAGDDALRRKAILGTIGDLDAPQLPDAKAHSSMIRQLTGDDEVLRNQLRAEVLDTTAKDLGGFAEALAAALPGALIAALGSAASLKALDTAAGGPVRVTPVLGQGKP